MNQGFVMIKLMSSLRKFSYPYHYMLNHFGVSWSQITRDMLGLQHSQSGPFLTTDVIRAAGMAYLSGALAFSLSYLVGFMLLGH